MPDLAPTLLFIDTNIWLDFYRDRGDSAVKLLRSVERLRQRMIVTYQLEAEFKGNRQQVLMESWRNLKVPTDFSVPNIVADAATTRVLKGHLRDAKKHIDNLKKALVQVMCSPAKHDPVYQLCQRIFHRQDNLVLSHDNDLRLDVRRKALRRFLHGYPPRKKNDTSLGDAFNWEWMIYCCAARKSNLVVVTRDSDYGITLSDQSYPNDHLVQEFKERVGKRRKLILYSRLTDGLKHFNVPVTKKETAAEDEWIASSATDRERCYPVKIIDTSVGAHNPSRVFLMPPVSLPGEEPGHEQ